MYVHVFESSHYTLSKIGMVYSCLSCHPLWGISELNIKKDAEPAEVQQNFLTSNPNISKTVTHRKINNTIFWWSVTKPLRGICVNFSNRLKFLDDVSTKFQKMHFFGQFKENNSGRKHGNQTNDPFFCRLVVI